MRLICAVANRNRAEQVKAELPRARSGCNWSRVIKDEKRCSLFTHRIYPWAISISPGGRLSQSVVLDPAGIEITAQRRPNGCE